MALDPEKVATPGTPEWWMAYMAAKLLDRNRTLRMGRLLAYLSGTPPMLSLAASDRKGWYRFHQLSRTNMARKVVRAKRHRMRIRSIRTAATTDDRGDIVAWRYWMRSGLNVASRDVHTDQLALNEGYVRVSVTPDGTPVALRRDPRFCIAIPDPLDPLRSLAGFELLWDELTSCSYAYLWIRGKDAEGRPVGQQWVAVSENVPRPPQVMIPSVSVEDARRCGWAWWPRLSFAPAAFTMRPFLEDVPEGERDGGPYCQTLAADVVPLFRFRNRDDRGEYEEHTDILDRINRTVCDRVIVQAIQAYKQRALQQEIPASGAVIDRLPATNPNTGEAIDWEAIFQPGPDALWKLPPGVKVFEMGETSMDGLLASAKDDLKALSEATDTPLPSLKDDVNESADGAQYKREGALGAVEECTELASGPWAAVIACMFLFAPDEDRYAPAGRGRPRVDRADPAQIVLDWAPPERHSLAERADADSKNKTLSVDDAARVIWGLSPDEVALNRARRVADIAELPALYRLSQLPAGLAANEVSAATQPTAATDPPSPPSSTEPPAA